MNSNRLSAQYRWTVHESMIDESAKILKYYFKITEKMFGRHHNLSGKLFRSSDLNIIKLRNLRTASWSWSRGPLIPNHSIPYEVHMIWSITKKMTITDTIYLITNSWLNQKLLYFVLLDRAITGYMDHTVSLSSPLCKSPLPNPLNFNRLSYWATFERYF